MKKSNRWQRLQWTVPLVLFFATIIDAALPAVFPVAFLGNAQVLISHIALFYVVGFAFYFRDNKILWYAPLFGLFYDSYNTTILGLYAAIYFVVAYVVLKVKRYFAKKPLIFAMFFIISIAFVDFIVFGFYSELSLTRSSMADFLVNRLTPTLILNIVTMLVLYWPTKSLLRWLGYEDYIIL